MEFLKVDKKDIRAFVTGKYHPAGRPKIEDELMKYASETYLHSLVYKSDIPYMARDLQRVQAEIRMQNRRLKEVKIGHSSLNQDIVWIRIGECHLTLQEVKHEIESIDEG